MQHFLQVESPGPASSSSGRFSELLPPTQGGGGSSCRASGGGGQGGKRGGSSRKATVPVPAGQSVCGHQPACLCWRGLETGTGLCQEMKDKYQGRRAGWPSGRRGGLQGGRQAVGAAWAAAGGDTEDTIDLPERNPEVGSPGTWRVREVHLNRKSKDILSPHLVTLASNILKSFSPTIRIPCPTLSFLPRTGTAVSL